MAGEGPPFLTVGTAVSAKYRGAFCEAKVKVVKKLVKCKINFKNGTSSTVHDEFIKGTLKVGVHVEAKQTENGPYEEGTIMKLTDASLYTVVFDDGDEKTLRRTLLCLQGEKHFHESETLDHLPLTDPENFGTPVVKDSKKMRRKRRASNRSHRSEDEEEEEEEDSDSDSSKKQPKDEPEDAVGKVVIVEMNEKRKNSFFPALVVDPSCTKDVQTRGKDQIVVRSLKDNKFYTVSKSSRKAFLSKDHVYKGDVASLKAATEKAVTFIDTGQLPPNWDLDMLQKKSKHGTAEIVDDTSEDSSGDEYDMEKDAWLASLHKYMEERATPINKPPVLGYRDLNLYKLYKLVQDQGGCRKVTDRQLWRHIMTKMGIPASATSQPYNIHTSYNKYLFAFEEFNRKMGPGPRVFTRTRRRSFDRGWISPTVSRQRSLVKVKDDHSDGEEEEEEEASPSKKRVTRKKGDDLKQLEPEETKRETREAKARAKEHEKEEKDTPDTPDKKVRKSAKDHKAKAKSKEDNAKEKATDVKEKQGDDKGKDKVKGDSKGKEKVKDDKSKDKTREDKGKEKPKDDKVKEKTREDKVKEKSREDKSTEKPKEDKSKEQPKEEEVAGKDKGKDKKGKVKAPGSKDEEKDDSAELDAGYGVGEKVLVQYGRGRTEKIYEAKVVDIEVKGKDHSFTVHYTGWNTRYDETVRKSRIVGSAEKKKKKQITPKGKGDKTKKDTDKKEKEEQERREREELERKEKEEKENRERLERELKEREERERLEKEKAEKERLEKERKEKLEKEQMEKLEKERLEKERKEKLEKERKEREKRERLERERQERELKVKQEKEKKEKLEKERLEREKKERQEKEKKERQEKEKRDKLERERKERERLEQEKQDKELEKAKEAEKERKEKEKSGKESKRTPNSKRGRPSLGKGSPVQQTSPRSSASGRGKSPSPASVFSQRSMRSDRKSLTESPFAGGLNVRPRPKRLSGTGEDRRDTQDSDSDMDEIDEQSESQQSTQDSEDLQLKDTGAQEEEGNEDSDRSKVEDDAATLTKVSEEKSSFDDDLDDGPPTLTAQIGPEASDARLQGEDSEAPKVEEVGKVMEEKEVGRSRAKKDSKFRLRKSVERAKDSSRDSCRETPSEISNEEKTMGKDGTKDDSEKEDDKEKMDETPVLERQVPVEADVIEKLKEKVEEIKQESKDSASDADRPTEKKKGRKKGRRSLDSRKRSKADTEPDVQMKQEDREVSEPKKKHSKMDRRKAEKERKRSSEQDAKMAADNADSDFGSSSVEDKSLAGTSKSFMTTPPTTPESSPKMPSSPSQEDDIQVKGEEQSSNKSDSDALIEVASIDEMSRSVVDMASLNSSYASIAQKKDASKSEPYQTSPKKRRRGASESEPRKKRRKHGRRRQSSISERRHSSAKDHGNNSSDTDESRSETRLTSCLSKHQLSLKNQSGNMPSSRVTDTSGPEGTQRQPRWNFLVDLTDVKEPDERIAIIQRQLCDLRQVYLQLKQEVASIDRRRKKFRKKEREAAHTMAGVAMGHCLSHTSERMDAMGS